MYSTILVVRSLLYQCKQYSMSVFLVVVLAEVTTLPITISQNQNNGKDHKNVINILEKSNLINTNCNAQLSSSIYLQMFTRTISTYSGIGIDLTSALQTFTYVTYIAVSHISCKKVSLQLNDVASNLQFIVVMNIAMKLATTNALVGTKKV